MALTLLSMSGTVSKSNNVRSVNIAQRLHAT